MNPQEFRKQQVPCSNNSYISIKWVPPWNYPQLLQQYDPNFYPQKYPQLMQGNQQTGPWSYRQLLQAYDPALLHTMQSINNQFLNTPIFLFEVDMSPDMMNWRLWKNFQEILKFLKSIEPEIKQMSSSKNTMLQNGPKIIDKYQQIKNNVVGVQNLILGGIRQFCIFLNMLANNSFMKKSQQFLLFIQHCVPLDKWSMKIYKHLVVYKSPTLANKFFSNFSNQQQQKQRNFFITITSDGILKSNNHLLESRIQSMIPFTNQLTIQCKQSPQRYLIYVIQACAHQQLTINFFSDYTNGINFMLALKMALKQSSYSDPNHRFGSYSPIRQNCASKLYNDGGHYFQDLFQALKGAKWQVCITGWMITPYFLLKRPNNIQAKQFRLDGVLQSLAERGVKVYIIAFMEPKMFVNNDSEHVQIYLQSLNDNIKVYRHPNNAIPSLWSHHQKMVIIDQQIGFMGGLDICYGRWDHSGHPMSDPGGLWDGADYNNFRIRDITTPRDYKNNNLNRGFEPRMPWHDIALQFRGDVVLDLLRHFVQYWYFVKSELNMDLMKTLSFLQKRYEQSLFTTKNVSEKQQMSYYLKQIKQNTTFQKIKYMFNGRQQKLPELLIQTKPGKKVGTERMQMCRSASEWSIGVKLGQHESSIHQAYQRLIESAQRFIYIQNQFFMGLQNKVVECLANKIEWAYRQRKNFKLVVVMPLLPGFQGNIADPNSTVLRIQVHHQYQAILRGETSLFKRLHFIPKEQLRNYIYFFGLRQSEIVDGVPMTEIIYVHSKLMIVDDCRAIIGSANINDRSLLGNRDSELACVIQQQNANIFDLRARLFNQHFGLSRQESEAFPGNRDSVWNKMIENSKIATEFYRQVFGCIPDDFVTCGQEVDKLLQKSSKQKYIREKRQKLVGHAVDFPLQFMKDEDLRFRMGQKEYLAPEMSFT